MELFLVGFDIHPPHEWGFIGVFDDKALAVQHCRDARYFLFSVALNHPLAHDRPECLAVERPNQSEPTAEALAAVEAALQECC